MKIAIMQPYFFPYIGYFQLIDAVDTFVIYEHVSFRKKSWITRNRILDKGSRNPIYINVPVAGKSSEKLIKDVQIDANSDWKKKLLNLIYYNYKKAPFFDELYPFIEKLILTETRNLHSYNATIISKITDLLLIKTPIIIDNSNCISIEEKLQIDFSETKESIKSERIIQLCKLHNSKTYINPIGGVDLYDKTFFRKNELKLFFVKTNAFSYPQFHEKFEPHLSIIDVLMHVGVEGTKQLIKEYKLI